MLAKIIKNSAPDAFASFPIPEIGEAKPEVENINSYAFPNFADFEQEPIKKKDFSAAPTVEDVLQNAREEAAQIIAQAKQQGASIEQNSREKMMHEARLSLESENSELITEQHRNLYATISQISGLADEIINRVENDVVELALQIAKKIVGREVMIDREIAVTLVKVSLKKLHSRAVAQVRLHPEDFAYIQNHREKIDFHGSLEIVEDRSVSPGGCLIHTDTGDVDARIESQFEEIAYGLLGS